MTYRPFNYDTPENQYAGHRRTDPRIAAYVHEALGDAQTIVNVGAGAGSYEPLDRYVFALEPSAAMRAQRPAGRPAIRGIAESIPVDDASVDAAMAMVTIHHWTNMAQGISEMKRVSRKRVVIMTFDPDRLDDFWNAHYFKEVIEVERSRYPTIDTITHLLGGQCRVQPVPIPLDCVDGFQEAFYGRPEAFLDKNVRAAQSAWGYIPAEQQDILVKRLSDDLASGQWDKLYGHFRTEPTFTCALRLIISENTENPSR
jgi:SAM-dependent methyltransferase